MVPLLERRDRPNEHIYKICSSSIDTSNDTIEVSRTELDSHANMVVVGQHAFIINNTGKTAEVSPFTSSYDALKNVPIVDAIIAFDCPITDKAYLLVCHNALYVSSMIHNLIPPFIMREANLVVNDIPKIQVDNPDETDHSIWFADSEFRITLSLQGIFSYFPSRKPTQSELEAVEDVLVLTPQGQTWDPHSTVYEDNEENMVDWQGNMIEPRHRTRIIVDELPNANDAMVASIMISKIESKIIDDNIVHQDDTFDNCMIADNTCDNVHVVLSGISAIHDPVQMYDKLLQRRNIGTFAASIGSTTIGSNSPFVSDRSDNNILNDLDLDNFDIDFDEIVSTAGATVASKPLGVTSQHLSKIWRIDPKIAEKTLDVTTQLLRRSQDPKLSRNYSTGDRMLRYKRIDQYFFMDTFFAHKHKGKSSRGYTCMQLFVTDKGFVHVIPMRSKSEVPMALKMFAKDVGAPDAIICDAAREQISKEVRDFCHKIGTSLRVLEEGTPWANRAELYIGLLKEAVRKDIKESDCPLVFWDYCCERRARINNMTASKLFQLEGRNAHFSVTGEDGDISNLCRFAWYEWCYYRDHTAGFPLQREILGRVLGPANGEGNEMAQWILKANGRVVPRRTAIPLTISQQNSESEKKKRVLFDKLIAERWGSSISPAPIQIDSENELEPYKDLDESPREMPEFNDPIDHDTSQLVDQQPAYDKLIHSEITLPQDNKLRNAKILRRTIDSTGCIVGTYNDNPILNTLIYDVEFPDGEVKEYSANVIAENLLSQVDDEGFTTTVFDSILDYKKDKDAIEKKDLYYKNKLGIKRMRKSTCGYKFLILWKDGKETWIALKDMKESHPVELAEFAKSRGLSSEPAFAWWVPYTLRKRDVIISSIKARIRRTTHKYGIEIPTSHKAAKDLDHKNGNDFWIRAIEKEMYNVGIAFEILDKDKTAPVGWSKESGHLVFDVKMDFSRKARWVLDGHRSADPIGSTYAGVVSRDSVRIALTYAALNDIDVVAADIQNAYLQAPSSQKYYIICGAEFGLENIGKIALIRRALYGGKSAGRDFRNHLRACMSHIGFTPCLADPDVWMRPAQKADGSKYWEYVLLYVDDALVISDNAKHILENEIGKYFIMKPGSIGPPKIYLGGHMRKITLENSVKAWGFSSSQYCQAAVRNVEDYLAKTNKKLPLRALTPIRTDYRPELDVTIELNAIDSAYYQSLIGILRWMVELGRVDICLEVSMLSSHLALPREGHLDQIFNIFAYLKRNHNSEMIFDPSDLDIDQSLFDRKDWTASEFGLTLEEVLPPNMPTPRGMGFVMRAFVDADHAGDSITRRSRTGFLIYLNSAPIYWMSKKQTSVETSSFGSEFIAMKQCTEYIRGLRYKLRMMGIPCNDPTFVFGDNQSVLANTTAPDSTLKKKSQSIAYHFVREGVARDEWRTAYVNTHLNPADLLTKTLPSGEKRMSFVRMLLYHIFG